MAPKDAEWRTVPTDVKRLTASYREQAVELAKTASLGRFLLLSSVGPISVKTAENNAPFAPLSEGFQTLQKPFGGPTPLTAALVGGALSAGLGYGSGWLMEHLFPERFVRRGPLRKNMALMGGVLGAGIPLYWHGRPAVQQHGWDGLTTKYAEACQVALEDLAKKGLTCNNGQIAETAELVIKEGDGLAGGILAEDSIPVDAFGRTVLNDPFTPGPIGAATAGLLEAASASRGGVPFVSPLDIARVTVGLTGNAASGLAAGFLLGKFLKSVAGLTPEAEQGVQRLGILGGVLRTLVPRIF